MPASPSRPKTEPGSSECVVHRLPKLRPDGTQHVELAVNELLYRLAALIPPPRRHRHRYHGVLAPNAALRRAITARAGQPIDTGAAQAHPMADTRACAASEPKYASYLWAALIARISAIAPALLYLVHRCTRTSASHSRARAAAPRCASSP